MFELLIQAPRGEEPTPVDGVLFIAEVPASDFITGDSLAILTELQYGVSQYSDAGWLHFELDGKTLYVAKKPIRNRVASDDLDEFNLRLGRTVTIKGRQYKCRVLTNVVPPYDDNDDGTTNPSKLDNSEWNRLFTAVNNGTMDIPAGPWPLYGIADLGFNSDEQNDFASMCIGQYTYYSSMYGENINPTRRDLGQTLNVATYANWESVAWRPVLELIP